MVGGGAPNTRWSLSSVTACEPRAGLDFIEWSWTPVEGADGYDVQFSASETFTDEGEIIPGTAQETSYRREGLEAGTSDFLRGLGASHVRSTDLRPRDPPRRPPVYTWFGVAPSPCLPRDGDGSVPQIPPRNM